MNTSPAPWKASLTFAENKAAYWQVYDPPTKKHFNGNPVANCFDSEANARLIAAAPELLQALKRVIAMHDDQMFVSGVDDCGIIQTNLKSARAAIASAEGRVV